LNQFVRPRPIEPGDAVARFDCGEDTLNDWLVNRALRNEKGGASRTFVTLERELGVVAGYYCLSASSIHSEAAPGALRRNMPDPIPIILIGRLAVDARFGGQGVGASLLQDAVIKSIEASRLIGARAVLVHALSESAESFYSRFGFQCVPNNRRVMFLLTKDAELTVAEITST
jgi:predicted N-acetyltransferase YhbS